ncbi:MAG: sigma-70 family RNA polymerase sigma factor [Saprospiraceae bacterium]|nr:sigma-70 family RNA polymerase sigma factor [Saprospiraceae bacterium]
MNIVLTLDHHSELDFINSCIRKERWAQKKLYETYYSNMMSVCLRYANNDEDALDILHEGFIKIFNNLEKYNPGTSLNGWIRTIMVNTSIDYYRKSLRRKTEDLENAYHVSVKEADAVAQFSEQEILQAVQELTPAYRMVFNLYVIEGYSHKEIAETVGITESTSRSNLVKARMKLQAALLAKDKTRI